MRWSPYDGMLFGGLTKGCASFGPGISPIRKVEPAGAVTDRVMRGVCAAAKE